MPSIEKTCEDLQGQVDERVWSELTGLSRSLALAGLGITLGLKAIAEAISKS